MIDLETMSILVVDDMKSMRLTIRKMLRTINVGKVLLFAENGKEGLEVLADTPCDLAIIDWNMPVMNGTQMLHKLRQDKLLRDMPVIMVTAENERDIVAEVAEGDIDAYLLKPLTLEALDRKIRSVVSSANSPDQATLHLMNARRLEEEKEYAAAIDEIRLALTHKPSASKILRKLGLLHFKIGKVKIGEKCLLKAKAVNPQDTITRDHLAKLYMKKKEYSKVAEIYLEILSLSTRYYEHALTLADKLLVSGQPPLAIKLYSKVLAKSQKNTAFKERVIDFCLKNQEYEYSKTVLDRALKDNPSNYDLLFKAGVVHEKTGDIDKALSCFRTVDSQKKGHVDAKLQIARIYFIRGKVIQADDYLNQVLRLDPGNPDAIMMRQEL